MLSINERLDRIEKKISEPNFLEGKGQANEVNYWVFDYEPNHELIVRNYVGYLKNKVNTGGKRYKIIEFDLYDVMMQILEDEGYMDDCLELEKAEGSTELFEAMIPALGLNEDNNSNNLILSYLLQRIPKDEERVVFLTGIGKCFPIIRSHTVLNNLHQVMDWAPVVLFFPGVYSGQSLQLFGTIKDDNYYRAFPLVPKEEY